MKKYDFDIAIVGAGPCGSSAARAAAEQGMRTVLIEEHPQIGLPEHCCGMLGGTKTGYVENIVLTEMDKRALVAPIRAERIHSPSGKVLEISTVGWGGLTVERGIFDFELARLAAKAGAEIMINTRVTGLIHDENGGIEGVKTESSTVPEISSKIVIAADGLGATLRGIAKWEGLDTPPDAVRAGILAHLAGVHDIEPGVLDFHTGCFGNQRGDMTLIPRNDDYCVCDIPSLKAYEAIKDGNWPLSKKIKDAKILRIQGWSHPLYFYPWLPEKVVKDGLMLAGDGALGIGGIDFAIHCGRLAGKMASAAVNKDDFTEAGLSSYNELLKELRIERTGYRVRFDVLATLTRGLSDEEIQNKFDELGPRIIGVEY